MEESRGTLESHQVSPSIMRLNRETDFCLSFSEIRSFTEPRLLWRKCQEYATTITYSVYSLVRKNIRVLKNEIVSDHTLVVSCTIYCQTPACAFVPCTQLFLQLLYMKFQISSRWHIHFLFVLFVCLLIWAVIHFQNRKLNPLS